MDKLNQRLPFVILIIALIAVGISSIYYRSAETGIPLFPGEKVDVWNVDSKIEFNANGSEVSVKLALPDNSAYQILEEHTASPGYGVHIIRDGNVNEVNWSKRIAEGPQTLYFQTSLREKDEYKEELDTLGLAKNATVWPEPYQSAAKSIVETAYKRSSNTEFFARELYKLVDSQEEEVGLLVSKYKPLEVMAYLLRMAEVPVKEVQGILLENNVKNQRVSRFLKVFLNKEWFILNPELGLVDADIPLLVWQDDTPSLLDIEGGSRSTIRFSVSKTTQSALKQSVTEMEDTQLFNFSLYKLPLAEQNVFRGILLLPLGALVVVFLRVMVGLKCSGTFMPILIATSFLQTTLVTGLIGFLAIVAAGLVIRSYLSNLNLLLVSRISAVVILVIGIIVAYTIISYQLGISEGLSIAFFPMIIMAWTIERMSILWEEEGGKEVLVQGGGSLIVAVIAYLLMSNEVIRHWAFNFLGIHLIVMAAILLMGQYSGYRLLELRRFNPLVKDN